MTQSPVFPALMPNLEFIENYIDSLENLPLDVQRYVSQIREYDLLYRSKLDTIGRYLCLYKSEPSGPSKRKYLNKIQKCLIKSQHYGDEKLSLISQIVELVDSRSQQLLKDAEVVYTERKEEEPRNAGSNSNSNNRVKIEKKTIVEKPVRNSIYVKPKRIRRVRALDKIPEKSERTNNSSRSNNKTDYEEEEEPMEEDEEVDVKPKKESKKKERDSKVTREKEKEKEKEKEIAAAKEEKEETKKEEKKSERKEKSSSGKVTKKTNNKQITSKIKKKKKKEKEALPEDIPVDPDEPTYCICNRISYGDMIGCDNQDCKIEWFHFDCVNLTHKPKGKWYCPRCTIERKEKGKK